MGIFTRLGEFLIEVQDALSEAAEFEVFGAQLTSWAIVFLILICGVLIITMPPASRIGFIDDKTEFQALDYPTGKIQ